MKLKLNLSQKRKADLQMMVIFVAAGLIIDGSLLLLAVVWAVLSTEVMFLAGKIVK